ncbi:unnamed protein product [Linum trigynum]|uniref:Uncharacterized protein n=1 Tax=Linum trigynum TaxID=586398 RepID=A0AAV2EUA4_9ROSI
MEAGNYTVASRNMVVSNDEHDHVLLQSCPCFPFFIYLHDPTLDIKSTGANLYGHGRVLVRFLLLRREHSRTKNHGCTPDETRSCPRQGTTVFCSSFIK